LKDVITRVKERPGFQNLEDSANLPDPDVIAAEIVEDLEAALQQFAAIGTDLNK
jgi:type I restriction enzyme M protein